ncbi:hypothetical protein XENTR_v10018791 [Xenopus tropicalis]|nr:hypothetical protein XENTR_v10018791 [Xenopus tropicalis]
MAAPGAKVQSLSKAEYLKRYLDSGGDNGEAKKKKKKSKRTEGKGMRIVDDDAEEWKKMPSKQEQAVEVEEEEDQPVVAEFVDERPDDVKQMEIFRTSNKWKLIQDTGNESSRMESSSALVSIDGSTDRPTSSPKRNIQNYREKDDSSDASPPCRKRHDSSDPSPPPRKRQDSSDKSLPRRGRHNSTDPSPPRRGRHASPGPSPPRRGRHASPGPSPPRRGRHDSPDPSPPRRGRHDSPDPSPPRKGRHDSPDPSPPRRGRHDSPDPSPPRRGRHDSLDPSVNRKRKQGSTEPSFSRNKECKYPSDPFATSKSRQNSSKSSPSQKDYHSSSKIMPHHKDQYKSSAHSSRTLKGGEKTKNFSSHDKGKIDSQELSSNSSEKDRKRRHDIYKPTNSNRSAQCQNLNSFNHHSSARHNSDSESPHSKKRDKTRKRRKEATQQQNSDSDLSPPRHTKKRGSDSDLSPPRHTRKDSDSDLSPPRHSKKRGSDSDLSPPRCRTDDHRGSAVGRIQKGESSRMLSGGRVGLVSAEIIREEKVELRKGLKDNKHLEDESRNAETVFRDKSGKRRDLNIEREQQQQKQAAQDKKDELYAQWGKGLAQKEQQQKKLEDAIKEMEKPLARYIDDTDLDKMLREQEREGDPMAKFLQKKKDKKTSEKKERPRYKGPNPPPNRYNIWPGYRWDGVDRSNGFEKQFFARMAEKTAVQEEAYKWSVEDM